MMKILLLMASWCLLFVSCGPSQKLEGFDADVWKSDLNGCGGRRLPMLTVFENQQEKIKGLHENELKSLLGQPDKQELYVRSQKFFVYYLEPGPLCKNGPEHPMALQVRFNSLGLTNEVFIENLSK